MLHLSKLVVIDGLDGSGKATQTKLLVEYLLTKNIKVTQLSYPDYKNESSTLVKLYLNGQISEDPFDVNPYAVSSFYACDRFIGFEKTWKKIYCEDGLIISDRYVSSNIIHQMVKLNREKWDYFLSWIIDYEFSKLGLPKEDLLIYLDMDPMISQKLIENRACALKNDIHETNLIYLLECRKAALYAEKKLGWKTVKCYDGGNAFSIENIADKIKKIVSEELVKWKFVM